MTGPEKPKPPMPGKQRSKSIFENKKVEDQSKSFDTLLAQLAGKNNAPKPLKPTKINLKTKNRHLNCVDEAEHRAEIAQYLLALGTYQNPKSNYEKLNNAQTEYLANAVRTNEPSMNSILFP